ncbi:MAG: fibronectin type III domain-containing protein [Clostridiales bacterium]|jgi:hypothetical protein|nr:fibronectin type III domain-containing protein [Clostridiales bacterium]
MNTSSFKLNKKSVVKQKLIKVVVIFLALTTIFNVKIFRTDHKQIACSTIARQTEAVLNWDSVANAKGYKVFVNGTPDPNIVTKNSYTLKNLLPGLTYHFNIQAVGQNGFLDSELSETFYFDVPNM